MPCGGCIRIRMKIRLLLALSILGACSFIQGAGAQISTQPDDPLAELRWRFIGPNGNRVAAVAGVPGNPFIAYAGAASGGIWKTENGGSTWTPVFDRQRV